MAGKGIATTLPPESVSQQLGSRYRTNDNKNDKNRQTYLGLNNLQIPHLNPRSGKVGNFEFDSNRSFAFATSPDSSHASSKPTHHASTTLFVALDRRKTEFGAHEEFFAAAELFDLPHNGRGFGGVVDGSDVCAKAGSVRVVGDGDGDFHVVCGGASFELCFGLKKGEKGKGRKVSIDRSSISGKTKFGGGACSYL